MKNYIAAHVGNLQSFRFIDIATRSFRTYNALDRLNIRRNF